jgi:sporulation protein YlmC with PRC-barrel domain
MRSNHSNNSHLATLSSSNATKLAGWLVGLAMALVQQPAGASQPGLVEMAPLIVSANELLGHEVRAWNVDGQKVGKINDALYDSASGQLVAWLAAPAHSSQFTLIPAKLCIPATTAEQQVLIAPCTVPGFNAAPRLSKETVLAGLNTGSLRDSFWYFGQSMPAFIGSAGGKLTSAKQMIGQRVIDREGESLGRVQDITFDLGLRQAIYVVIQPSVGASQDFYGVPPSALQAGPGASQLVLNANQATFLAGAHFPKMYNAELAQPQMAAAVYAQYGAPTWPWAFLGQTASGTLATTPSGVAIPSPVGRSDAQIFREYLTEFSHVMPAPGSMDHAAAVGDGSVSVVQVSHVGTVEVSNSNIAANVRGGRITLTGEACNENQKLRIAAAAARVVGSNNVDDQITIR